MLSTIYQTVSKHRNSIKSFIKYACIPIALLLFSHAFAAGKDLLEGTTDDLSATILGKGKTFIYLAEIVLSIIVFLKTRNPAVFIGIIIITIGFNVMIKLAGLS